MGCKVGFVGRGSFLKDSLACLGSRTAGSMSGTPMDVSQNCLQNLLHNLSGLLALSCAWSPSRGWRAGWWSGWRRRGTSSRRCRTRCTGPRWLTRSCRWASPVIQIIISMFNQWSLILYLYLPLCRASPSAPRGSSSCTPVRVLWIRWEFRIKFTDTFC